MGIEVKPGWIHGMAAGSRLMALNRAETWLLSRVYVSIVAETVPSVPRTIEAGVGDDVVTPSLDGTICTVCTGLPPLIEAVELVADKTSSMPAILEDAITMLYVVDGPTISNVLSSWCGETLAGVVATGSADRVAISILSSDELDAVECIITGINDGRSYGVATARVMTVWDVCDMASEVLAGNCATSEAMMPPKPVTVDVGSLASVGSPLITAVDVSLPLVLTGEAGAVPGDCATIIMLVGSPFKPAVGLSLPLAPTGEAGAVSGDSATMIVLVAEISAP